MELIASSMELRCISALGKVAESLSSQGFVYGKFRFSFSTMVLDETTLIIDARIYSDGHVDLMQRFVFTAPRGYFMIHDYELITILTFENGVCSGCKVAQKYINCHEFTDDQVNEIRRVHIKNYGNKTAQAIRG